jgi:hypothetical protein
MAAGPFIFPNKSKLNFFNATKLLDATNNTYKLALVTSGWTPNNGDAGNELWGDVSTYQVALGSQTAYADGGATVTGDSTALGGSNNVSFTFTGPSPTWTADGTGIPAWKYGVLYASGTLNGKLNPIVGHFLGDSGGANIAITTSGNTLTVTVPSGVLSAT